jgi:hypothetical protein
MTDTTVKEAGGFLAAKQGGDIAYTAAKEAAAYSELASEARCATSGRTRTDTTIKPTVGDGGETTMLPGRVYAAYEAFI